MLVFDTFEMFERGAGTKYEPECLHGVQGNVRIINELYQYLRHLWYPPKSTKSVHDHLPRWSIIPVLTDAQQ